MEKAPWESRLHDVLRKLDDAQLRRSHFAHRPVAGDPFCIAVDSLDGVTVVEGKELCVFASNDYLGLSTHPEIRAVAAETARIHGMGPRSSPLVSGYTYLHARLEKKLARLTRKETCLLLPTGYAANVCALTALSEGGDVAVFSDALNHASIIDGARLAQRNGAALHIYRHCDMAHLEELLKRCSLEHKIVVTESLFSMDGDFAPLKALAALRSKYGFLFLVDEAHALLVAGDTGGGVSERDGVQQQIRSLLTSRGRTHIFSTSLPMPVAAAAIRAIDIAQRETWRQKHLQHLVQHLCTRLHIPVASWIVPIVLGTPTAALSLSQALKQENIYIPAIRPPTVPSGTSRLRLSLSSRHSLQQVENLIYKIKALSCTCKKANQ